MAVLESLLGLGWIAATLKGESTYTAIMTGGLYDGIADATVRSANPFKPFGVIAQVGAGEDLMALGMTRVWSEGVFTLTLWDKGTYTRIGPAAAIADGLLHGKSTNVTNGQIVTSYRDIMPMLRTELIDGVTWKGITLQFRQTIRQT